MEERSFSLQIPTFKSVICSALYLVCAAFSLRHCEPLFLFSHCVVVSELQFETDKALSPFIPTLFSCHCEHCASSVWQSHTLSPALFVFVLLHLYPHLCICLFFLHLHLLFLLCHCETC